MPFDNVHNHTGDGHRGPHIDLLVNESVSQLAPYAGLILTIVLVIIFGFRLYVFEGFLMKRLYGERYTNMEDGVRRGFVNHHMAGAIKLVLFAAAAYPFIDVAFADATMHSSFDGRHSLVKMGDVLVVCSQLFIGMYVFELFYRPKISIVSSLHHIGAIVIAQAAVAISLDFDHEVDATIEFILCFVWGAFDVFAEFLPHVAIILYRVYPTDHEFLARIFKAACITELVGTTTETIVVMWLFGGLWDRWTLPFKVVTPILHLLFSIAQLWGAIIFRRMWKQQERLLVRARGTRASMQTRRMSRSRV